MPDTKQTSSSALITPSKTDDLWRCAWCGKHWVVPELARACEARHEADRGDSANS